MFVYTLIHDATRSKLFADAQEQVYFVTENLIRSES